MIKSQMDRLEATGEQFGFGVDFSDDYQAALQSFVKSEGMTVDEANFLTHKSDKGAYVWWLSILNQTDVDSSVTQLDD
ncbi:MAG: hypothetical protein GY796_11120 [Chloroflexi bacterium]|nr:hypothetical protein [Chloroflexota bacterium]